MIELANQLADSVERCREYMRFCVVAAVVSEALTFLAAVEDTVPLDSLYEALAATWVPYVKVLKEHKDVAIEIINKAVKYAEARGEVREGKVTRDGLLFMSSHLDATSHLDAIRSFLNCVI
jgi:nucleotide-binding universal stress UspA family protein